MVIFGAICMIFVGLKCVMVNCSDSNVFNGVILVKLTIAKC